MATPAQVRSKYLRWEVNRRRMLVTVTDVRDVILGLSPDERTAFLDHLRYGNANQAGALLVSALNDSVTADAVGTVDTQLATGDVPLDVIQEIF